MNSNYYGWDGLCLLPMPLSAHQEAQPFRVLAKGIDVEVVLTIRLDNIDEFIVYVDFTDTEENIRIYLCHTQSSLLAESRYDMLTSYDDLELYAVYWYYKRKDYLNE